MTSCLRCVHLVQSTPVFSLQENTQAQSQAQQAHENATQVPDTAAQQGESAAEPGVDEQTGSNSRATSGNPQRNFADMLRDAGSISAEVAATMWRRAAGQIPGTAPLPCTLGPGPVAMHRGPWGR